MLAISSCRLVVCCNILHSPSHKFSNRNGSKSHRQLTLAKKNDFSEIQPNTLPFRFSVIQSSAVGVFALGFIDAGYSGDWSRIGVISRGTEDLLKAAAFLVVPLSIFLIFKLSRK